ncbi:DEAD/DEAH box helicase [Tahibacter harae]|uniref:DEAD/DEAH box helicase n=1 Tax=Tahibacter harae TaxID=2963937 RepID=A0ABT1QTB1_9GAMM|nr:DEAD/DEAH box helicase [Tahibacter harae]MCQ4165509.1 DEAD/DEAH box helicase [Tahibacter harae]
MHEAIGQLEQVLRRLTDFQRATVQVVCARLQSAGPARRMLVADEVGLGKTLIARGVIATLLKQRLERGADAGPLRVAYICSNQALARENLKKLEVFSGKASDGWVHTPEFGRLAELGVLQPAPETGLLVSLLSLTPATSFALTQGHGNAVERYLLWRAFTQDQRDAGLKDQLDPFFRKGVHGAWDAAESQYRKRCLNPETLQRFQARLDEAPPLDARHQAAATALALDGRSWRSLVCSLLEKGITWESDGEGRLLSLFLLSRLRRVYVECCAQNLQADLFILDEFQRFKDLVIVAAEGEEVSEQQIIARHVLHRDRAALLLSATPFKALSQVDEEDEGKAHLHEFSEVLRYLCGADEPLIERFQQKRAALLAQVLKLPLTAHPGRGLDDTAKRELQALLRGLICRTERAGLLAHEEQALHEVAEPPLAPLREEIDAYVELDRLARQVREALSGSHGSDVMAFFKAAPWCLSFLGGYQFRQQLQKWCDDPGGERARKLDALRHSWIPHEAFNSYRLDLAGAAPGARFRRLLQSVAPAGAEQLLWLPPSLPYYPGEGPFAGLHGFSKSLLFSSLVLAPRALSSYVSYACERRLVHEAGLLGERNYFDAREERQGSFRLDGEGISTGWGLIYPGLCLAAAVSGLQADTLAQVRRQARAALRKPCLELKKRHAGPGRSRRKSKSRRSSGPKTARWYALAPFLLDLTAAGESGRQRFDEWLEAVPKQELSDARSKQFKHLGEAVRAQELALGPPPADLLDYLADLAIAGPGVALWRSLSRLWPDAERQHLLGCGADAGLALLHKFNRAESRLVLRAVCGRRRPAPAVAAYAAMGNLQAVLDEYFHLLRGACGQPGEAVAAFKVAAGAAAVSVVAQKQLPPKEQSLDADVRFHCHYAVPLGNQRGTDEKGVERISNLRAAFNSPFWPFMLNSTSIGQEGLDFHWYCRRVVHWSLPSNPIDLEQREGRVNRYKSLVVRQRAAQCYRGGRWSDGDIWDAVFAQVKQDSGGGDLIPCWHVPGGDACVERLIPRMPFSREVRRRHELLRILSLYRLSFGQPRQQELIEELLRRDYSSADLAEIRRALLVELAPVKYIGLC